jgi:hypothetical protein
MIELVLVVFLLSVAVMATMMVKVGMKAVDFVDATYKFYDRIEAEQKEIIQLLKERTSDTNT